MKQAHCNISVTQYQIMQALERGLSNRRELEFELKTAVKQVDRAVDGLVAYGLVNAIPVNEPATPHPGRRLVRFELSEVGRDMLGVLRRIND